MKFEGKVDQEDLKDIRRLARTKMFWARLVLAYWYPAALLVIAVWASVAGMLGYAQPNWSLVALVWAMLVAIFLWAVHRTKRILSKELTRLNAALPDQVYLTNEGIKMDGPDGGTRFLPWSSFKGWREGQRVFLVDQNKIDSSVVLGASKLSEIERQSLRQLLRSSIPSTA